MSRSSSGFGTLCTRGKEDRGDRGNRGPTRATTMVIKAAEVVAAPVEEGVALQRKALERGKEAAPAMFLAVWELEW